MRLFKVCLISLGGIWLAFFCSCSAIDLGGDDSDDDADDDNGACSVSEADLSVVSGEIDGSGCADLGLTVIGDKILANAFMNQFLVQGQYSIDNGNTYFVRGAGSADGPVCYDTISGAGTFSLSIEFASCTESFNLDIVTSEDTGAVPFCSITVTVQNSCDQGDDDGDDDDGDIKQECIDFYSSCYGISTDQAESYCAFIDQYNGLGQCYEDAIDEYLTCIFENFDCSTYDTSTIQECVDNYTQDLLNCGDDDIDDDDDDLDDDDIDDDDDDGNTPILSNGGWDPPAFTWEAACGDPSATEPCTTLTWAVCDPDNNLLPDGMFFIYATGTTQAFFTGGPGMPISDFNFQTTPDFSDCDAPVDFGIGLLITEDQFGGSPGDYTLACDIEATDTDGNLSNKLTDIELVITYEG